MLEVKLSKATSEDLTKIAHYAKLLKLDVSPTNEDTYTVAKINSQIVGFVREKTHDDSVELSTLGVMPDYQNKSIGRLLIKDFIEKTSATTIYIVTVIPNYFEKAGFRSTCNYPISLKEKKEDCKNTCNTSQVSVMLFKTH